MKDIFKKLPKRARWSMLLSDVISGILIIGIAFIIKSVIISFHIPDFVKQVVGGVFYVVVVFSVLDTLLAQCVLYHRVKYLITDKSVETYKGIYFMSHEIVPIRRMQQVDIEMGPINKMFNLSSVHVITAGGKIELEYIDRTEAEEIAALLKDRINEFQKEERSDAA